MTDSRFLVFRPAQQFAPEAQSCLAQDIASLEAEGYGSRRCVFVSVARRRPQTKSRATLDIIPRRSRGHPSLHTRLIVG
jgi:hypothetical protein